MVCRPGQCGGPESCWPDLQPWCSAQPRAGFTLLQVNFMPSPAQVDTALLAWRSTQLQVLCTRPSILGWHAAMYVTYPCVDDHVRLQEGQQSVSAQRDVLHIFPDHTPAFAATIMAIPCYLQCHSDGCFLTELACLCCSTHVSLAPLLAFYACRQAADGGDADAVAHLGHMYANGVGVDQNNETATQLFQAAADAGNPNGQFGLGYMHLTGHGVEQNHRAAFKLFQRASEAVSMSRLSKACQCIRTEICARHGQSYHFTFHSKRCTQAIPHVVISCSCLWLPASLCA